MTEQEKEIVAKALEKARAEKVIGLSLEAKVILYAEAEEYDFIKDKVELLKEICMVSGLEISENRRNQDEEVAIGVEIQKADGEKCDRCWKYSTTVGADKSNPTLCHDCIEALK